MTRIISWFKRRRAKRAKERAEDESYEEANSVLFRE